MRGPPVLTLAAHHAHSYILLYDLGYLGPASNKIQNFFYPDHLIDPARLLDT